MSSSPLDLDIRPDDSELTSQDQSTLVDDELMGYISVQESEMETLNDTIKTLVQLVETQRKELAKTKNMMAPVDRTDIVNQVLDEVIHYNSKPSSNPRDTHNDLVKQFEREFNRQGLNEKLESIKAKVRNKIKNEVMSEVQSEMKSAFSDIEKKFKKGREDMAESFERELLAGLKGKDTLNTSIPINNYVCDELVNSYRDAVQKTLLPAMKTTYHEHCNHLAACTNTAVSDCLAQLQQQNSSSAAVNNKTKSLSARLQNLQNNTPDHNNTINMICNRTEQRLKEFKVTRATAEPSIEHEIEALISECNYHEALNKSLCANNLDIVVETCQAIDVDDMFKEKPKQPVLLSLLAQLQVNLSNCLDVKISYISESLQSLEEDADVTKSHGVSVLSGLQANIEKTMAQDPQTRSSLKQLLWGTKTLIRALRPSTVQ